MHSTLVREIPGRGRCIIAGCDYSPGDLVLSEEPYAMVVDSTYADVACSYCCTLCSNGSMYALSATSQVRYCSEQCITDDHDIHSLEVPSISALEAAVVQGQGLDAMRLVFRIASWRKREQQANSASHNESISDTIPLNGRSNTFKHILLLEANTKSISTAGAREVSRTAAGLADIAKKCSLPLNAIETRSLLYAIQCNAHQILNKQAGTAGVALGLFPYTSMMNHSCFPNCIHRFHIEPGRPPRLILRAITDIKEGEELCYSYVGLYQSTAHRREQLHRAYSFKCICERCTVGDPSCAAESSPSSSSSGLGISDDKAIDQVEGSADATKVAEVERFVSTVTNKLGSDTQAQLETFLSGDDAGIFHPAHRILFLCYYSACVSSVGAAIADSKTATAGSLRRCIGFGLLALGCMRKYVTRLQTEMGYLEERVVLAIALLIEILAAEAKQETDGKSTSLLRTEGKESNSGQSAVDVLFTCGYLMGTYWGARMDHRVRDLIEIACGLQPTSDIRCSTSSDTLGSEEDMLQNLIVKLRSSSELIAHMCRSNVEVDDAA